MGKYMYNKSVHKFLSMFTSQKIARRVFWKNIGSTWVRSQISEEQLKKTFEIQALSKFALYSVRKEIQEKLAVIYSFLTIPEKKHLASITRLWSDGSLEAWVEDGFQMKKTQAIFDRLRSNVTVQSILGIETL